MARMSSLSWRSMFAQPQTAEDLFVLKKVIETVSRERDMIWLKTRKARSLLR